MLGKYIKFFFIINVFKLKIVSKCFKILIICVVVCGYDENYEGVL